MSIVGRNLAQKEDVINNQRAEAAQVIMQGSAEDANTIAQEGVKRGLFSEEEAMGMLDERAKLESIQLSQGQINAPQGDTFMPQGQAVTPQGQSRLADFSGIQR